jgi:hypothetical protein
LRQQDTHVVTVVAGVVVNINGAAIAVAVVIAIFIVLTAAATIAIATTAGQSLFLLSLLADCCLLEVLKCLNLDVVKGLAKSPRSSANKTSNGVNIDDSISSTRGVYNVDNNKDDDGDNVINDSRGTGIPEH